MFHRFFLSLVYCICVLTAGQAQNMAPVTLGVQLLEGKQVSINAVLSGGLAEKMKLQKGDIIQEIGGVKIKSQAARKASDFSKSAAIG